MDGGRGGAENGDVSLILRRLGSAVLLENHVAPSYSEVIGEGRYNFALVQISARMWTLWSLGTWLRRSTFSTTFLTTYATARGCTRY